MSGKWSLYDTSIYSYEVVPLPANTKLAAELMAYEKLYPLMRPAPDLLPLVHIQDLEVGAFFMDVYNGVVVDIYCKTDLLHVRNRFQSFNISSLKNEVVRVLSPLRKEYISIIDE